VIHCLTSLILWTSAVLGLDNAGVGGSTLNQLLGSFNYGYDSRGDLASISEPRRNRSFQYDAIQRLTKVTEPQPTPTPAVTRESYTLDAEGNRTATHASSFHVTAPTNRLIEDDLYTYDYDINGNMVSKLIKASGKQWVYSYDNLDRMTRSELRPAVGNTAYEMGVDYSYDGLERRYLKVARAGAAAATSTSAYIHDGDNVYTLDERPAGGARKRQWFTQGGVDDLFATTPTAGAVATTTGPGTVSYYYSTDHLGTARALHNGEAEACRHGRAHGGPPNGQVVADLDNDSYGNPEVTVESVAQPFRFTGRELDRETGLYYYRARMYDAGSGRFLQEDPLWLNAGDHNFYRYTWNNPLRYTDPSGMSPAIEYGCLSQFGAGASATIGGGSGLSAWVQNFPKIPQALKYHHPPTHSDQSNGRMSPSRGRVGCRWK
jgi:RHS repeat-associated protein